ncbi:MAG: peptidoglycan DD-metalloendopeptidase family protein [Nostocaceae cyanobacterium]|nr:peptidoglycan DD-metalloendopeptidase family protein [Nostocaceae cyanobacterium]
MGTPLLRKKRFLFWLNLLLCCILWFIWVFKPSSPVDAASVIASKSIENLQQEKQKIDRQRQNVDKEQKRLQNLQQEAEKRLSGLEKNLQTTNNQILDSEQRLEMASQRLQQLQADLAAAEVSYQQQQEATIARLRFLQQSPVNQGWAVLLQSQNLNDFLSRRRNLKLVYQADQKILANLTAQANQINQQKTDVEATKNEIALIRQQLLAQKADYQTQAQVQEDLIGRLNSDRNALEAAQAQLDQDSQQIAALIQRKIAEAKAREAAAKARSRRNFIRGSGILAYPSDAPISSPFGWRTHPILGYRRLHTGMDFAGSYGSTIRAADSGTVIFAGWYGGYGKTVIINHGKNISTLYGHSSQLYVFEGQTVKKRQAIAAVGSTGLSTGPHLHFEVRKNGTPVNPANYL